MPRLLHIDSSLRGSESRSRKITAAFATEWSRRGGDFSVRHRDLASAPLPYLQEVELHCAAHLRDSAVNETSPASLQIDLIEELLTADALLVGAPMYNFSVPATLKTWIDYVHVPGWTAPFGESVQPLAGMPCVIVSSRGGAYDSTEDQAHWDHTVPPLVRVFGDLFGMTVEVVLVSRTLATRVPAMAGESAAAELEFQRALEAAKTLARSVQLGSDGIRHPLR